ncbi:diaminopimelate epimerase [Castellaniella caeni]|uniref:diaminopimelate epimerase n=1 Tax=Castellaniella caeni TaxID=266123 RepID=UPI0008373A5B|nr:diaminopimelate epimerase [Castellaniella caeni]
MIWNFTKMHGAGNDFVMLDGVRQSIQLTPERARALADRHFGVGADQILLVEDPLDPSADFRYRIFNADGGEVEHCGNGARCFVRFVHEQGLSRRNPLRAEIATGLIVLTAAENGEVAVDMGHTWFTPERLAFDPRGLPTRASGGDTQYGLDVADAAAPVWCSLVAISNPHAVMQVDDVEAYPVARIGPLVESHPRFAQRVNAGFMQVLGRHHIRLRVYERGAGETLACGTGACAAAVAGIRRGLLDSPVQVDTHGGTLHIEWTGETLRMRGPTTTVFQGQIDIDALVATQAGR